MLIFLIVINSLTLP